MSSEKVEAPISTSFAPLDEKISQVERSQATRDLFDKMNQGRTRGKDRSLGIMCKMGPSTEDVKVLEEMIVAGMTIAMIKCAEMSGEAHIREMVAKLREANDSVSKTLNLMYPVAICIKTVGPEMYIGTSEEGEDAKIYLETGTQILITFNPAYKDKCNKDVIYCDYESTPNDVGLKLYSRILLNRGKIKLKVCEIGINDDSALCEVATGGVVPSGAVISFPDSYVELPTITALDSKNVQLAIELQCDVIMVTHTQSAADVEGLRQTLREKSSPMFICANISDIQGFRNLDEIIKAADGVCIPRGYVERVPFSWNLFLSTKTLMAKLRSVSKPTLVTSKFLSKYDELIEPATPDVANSVQVILEGADVFGLGYEVAFGPDPVKCIRSFTDTCREANEQVDKEDLIEEISRVVTIPHKLVTYRWQCSQLAVPNESLSEDDQKEGSEIIKNLRPRSVWKEEL